MTNNEQKPCKKIDGASANRAGAGRPTAAPDKDDPDRLLPISQFARSTGIARSALIYYDETGVFHPAKRDPKNNYRYYRPEQIITANLVNVLAELNIPLKQIKALSSERSAASMFALFDEHHDTLQEHITQLQQAIKLIDVFRDLLSMGGEHVNEAAIAMKTIPLWHIIIGPENTFPPDGKFYQPFLEFCSWAQEQGYPINFPIGGYFSDFESFCAHPGEPDNFFLLLDTNKDSTNTIEVLTAYSRGFYGQVGDITERMQRALAAQKLKPRGPLLCTYIEDEISTVDPSQYLMMASMCVQNQFDPHGDKEKQDV